VARADILEQRDRSILQAVVSSFIASGEPIGSRFLSKRLSFNLSSATIRNIMSDLEELGYLKQPHVSAGRIPTDKAYRFYVDSLVREAAPGGGPPEVERTPTGHPSDPENLMRGTSRTLSAISRYVGLVLAPRFIDTVLRHIEFVRIGRDRVLAILVSREGFIHNRLLATTRDWPQPDLDRMGALLNERFADRPLREARHDILRDMAEDKNAYDSLLVSAIEFGRRSLEVETGSEEVYLEGAANILTLPEFADADKMRRLFLAFEEKSHIIELLDRCVDADGIKIFIGAENDNPDLADLSLVTAPYRKEGSVLGVIGVLGPTRMDYGQVIPMVDRTARYLSMVLSEGL
jgi:heat-inducible transcriptional repressor